jgi:uncharacterized protein
MIPAVESVQVDQSEPVHVRLGDLRLILDLSGALWLPDELTLVVSDLHLEKGASLARRGTLLPPYDTATTLAHLAQVCRRYLPKRIIALGDSFHDPAVHLHMNMDDRSVLSGLVDACNWIWMTGNHDPLAPAGLGGCSAHSLMLRDVLFQHEPDARSELEVAGHLHPVAKVKARGRAIRRKAFAVSSQRLIMPAMGAYAGGLNVCDAAFNPHFPQKMTAYVAGHARIFRVEKPMLLPD